MSDSIRKQLVSAVKARFEGITITDGYETDLGPGKVYIFRDAEPDEAESVFIDIKDVKETRNENPQPRIWEVTLDFEILLYFLGDETTEAIGEKLRALIADIQTALGVETGGIEGRRWQGLAMDTQYTNDEMALVQQGRVIGIGIVRFSIVFRQGAFSPYTQ